MLLGIVWAVLGKKLLEGTPGNGIFENVVSVFDFQGATIIHEEEVPKVSTPVSPISIC